MGQTFEPPSFFPYNYIVWAERLLQDFNHYHLTSLNAKKCFVNVNIITDNSCLFYQIKSAFITSYFYFYFYFYNYFLFYFYNYFTRSRPETGAIQKLWCIWICKKFLISLCIPEHHIWLVGIQLNNFGFDTYIFT